MLAAALRACAPDGQEGVEEAGGVSLLAGSARRERCPGDHPPPPGPWALTHHVKGSPLNKGKQSHQVFLSLGPLHLPSWGHTLPALSLCSWGCFRPAVVWKRLKTSSPDAQTRVWFCH